MGAIFFSLLLLQSLALTVFCSYSLLLLQSFALTVFCSYSLLPVMVCANGRVLRFDPYLGNLKNLLTPREELL
jgi:hypothetical protein